MKKCEASLDQKYEEENEAAKNVEDALHMTSGMINSMDKSLLIRILNKMLAKLSSTENEKSDLKEALKKATESIGK